MKYTITMWYITLQYLKHSATTLVEWSIVIIIIIIITCCKEIVVWSLSCDSTEVKRNINTFQDLVQLWMAGLIGRGTAKLLLWNVWI